MSQIFSGMQTPESIARQRVKEPIVAWLRQLADGLAAAKRTGADLVENGKIVKHAEITMTNELAVHIESTLRQYATQIEREL